MEIIKGKFYQNKTSKYLLPYLIPLYGKVFNQKFNTQIFKLAVGVHDTLLDNTNILNNKKAIYILVDKTVIPQEFKKFKDWITYKDFYIIDYQYDEDKHMFVLEIPEKAEHAYQQFKRGNYSKMYTQADIDLYFYDDKYKDIRKVFYRTSDKRKEFVNKVRTRYEVNINETDFIEAEVDFPPSVDQQNEIFNYEQ